MSDFLQAMDWLVMVFIGLPALAFFLSFVRLAALATWESVKQMNYRTFKVMLNITGFLWFFWWLGFPWWVALIGMFLCNFVASVVMGVIARVALQRAVNRAYAQANETKGKTAS